MASIYERKDMLKRKYESFIIQKEETVTAMMQRFTHLINDLKGVDLTYSNDHINRTLLNSLPSKWSVIITTINRTRDLRSMTLEQLMSIIQAEINRDEAATEKASQSPTTKQSRFAHVWSSQFEEVIHQNKALMASDNDIPPEVFTDLCSPSCLNRIVKYRHHNQTLIDDFNRVSMANEVLIENEQIWKDKVKSLNETISQLQSDLGDKTTQLNDVLTRLTSTKKELADAQENLLKSETRLFQMHDATKQFNIPTKKNMMKGVGFKAVPPPADYARLPDFTKNVFVKPTVSSLDPEISSAASANSKVFVSDSGVKVETQEVETAMKARISSSSNTSTSSRTDNVDSFVNFNFFDELDLLMKAKFDELDKEHNIDSKFVSTNDDHDECDLSNTKPLKEKGKNVIVIPENEASTSNTANVKPSVLSCSTDTSQRKYRYNKHKTFQKNEMKGKVTRTHYHSTTNLFNSKTKPNPVQNKFVYNHKPPVPEVKVRYMTKSEAVEYRRQRKLRRKGFQKRPSKSVYVPKQKTDLPRQNSKDFKTEKFIFKPKDSSIELDMNPSDLVLVKVRTYDLKGRPKTVTAWVSKSN